MKKINFFSIFAFILVLVVSFSSCKKDDLLPATITGTIINSQTGEGLANATLSFYEEGNKSGDPVFIIVTDSYGSFASSEAFVGTFTLIITAPNFIETTLTGFVISAIAEENYFPPITMVQNLGTDGVLRIVLTWGVDPYDLDSHLTGPISGSVDRFHMYFSDDTPVNSNVNLDVDDTYSYGPETTTIISYTDGMYRYSVHNYSNSTESGASEAYSSPATVRIYNSSGLIKTYTCPSASATAGDTWVVFELNVAGGVPTIVDKNTFYLFGSASSVTKGVKK